MGQINIQRRIDKNIGIDQSQNTESDETSNQTDSGNSCQFTEEIVNKILNELNKIEKKSSPNCLMKDETIESIANIRTQVAKIQEGMTSLQSQSLSDLDAKIQEISDCISALDIHTISDAIDGSYKDAVKNLTNDLNQIILQKLDEVINSIEGQLDDINENMATQSSVVELWDNNHGLNDIFKRVNEIKNLLDKIDISSFQYKINDSVNELEALVSKLQGCVGLTSDEYSASSSANVKKIQEHITDKVDKATKPVSDKITSLSAKLNDIKKTVEEIQKNTKPSGSSVVYTSLKPEHKTYFTWTAIFAIALILSAIFIAHRYPFDFANPICLVSIIAFCVSFVATCGYNLYFAFRGIDLSNSEGKRLRYFVICGIFVGITLGFSIAVLAI